MRIFHDTLYNGLFKSFCLILYFGVSPCTVHAQDTSRFYIGFADKKGSLYSISDPSAFLSGRAINRRANQGIGIKENDLPVNQWYIDSVAKTGVKILNRSKWLNAISIDTSGHPDALTKILSYPFVTGSKLVGMKKLNNQTAQNLPTGKSKFGSSGTISTLSTGDFGSSLNQASMIGDDCLQSQGYNGKGIVIAVLDGGFYLANTLPAFDSLWANNQILGTRDFSNQGGNVFDDISAHGMMVLSTMGGYLNGELIGTAPKAGFWLLRSEVVPTENIIEEFNWVAAAEFADSVGADIISSSLGYTTFGNPLENQTYAQMNGRTAMSSIAAVTASEKGILVVVSAGNDGDDSWHYIGSPADADSILTVGAVDQSGNYAPFSSTGPTSDGRIKPTIAAQGENSIVASTSGGTIAASGTSFSCPISAGAAACLWQANPGKTNMQIIAAIVKTGSLISDPDSLMGYGIPDLCQANILLGVKENNMLSTDNIILSYPNPFNTFLKLVFNSFCSQSIEIQLFDIRGRKITEKTEVANNIGLNYFTLNTEEATDPGVYVLKVVTQSNSYYRRLVK
jgi:serine protease AprX